MTFGESINVCLRQKYASFQGRATRSEFWWFALFIFIVNFVINIIGSVATGASLMATFSPDSLSEFGGGLLGGVGTIIFMIIGLIVWLYFLCPSIGVTVRRLHDTGRSGWWYWIILVPFVGGLVLFIFMLLGSEPNDNEYGPYEA